MRSPFKIAAPWIPCLWFYVDIAEVSDVGGRPLARKSRLREFTLSLRAFNLRMQALRPLQPSKRSDVRQHWWCVLPVSNFSDCRVPLVRIGTDEGASRAH